MQTIGKLINLGLNWLTKKTEITLSVEAKAQDIEALKDKKLSIQIKPYREKRSYDANAYYWVLLTKLAETLQISKAYAHNLLLRRYGQLEVIDGKLIYVVVPDRGERIADEAETYHIKPTSELKYANDGTAFRTYIMLRGSSTYNRKEMATLIDGLVSECKELEIPTLPPDEIERMKQEWGVEVE